jgi:hypothetical protein
MPRAGYSENPSRSETSHALGVLQQHCCKPRAGPLLLLRHKLLDVLQVRSLWNEVRQAITEGWVAFLGRDVAVGEAEVGILAKKKRIEISENKLEGKPKGNENDLRLFLLLLPTFGDILALVGTDGAFESELSLCCSIHTSRVMATTSSLHELEVAPLANAPAKAFIPILSGFREN